MMKAFSPVTFSAMMIIVFSSEHVTFCAVRMMTVFSSEYAALPPWTWHPFSVQIRHFMSLEYAILTVNGFRTPCNDTSNLRAPQWPQMFDQTDVVSVRHCSRSNWYGCPERTSLRIAVRIGSIVLQRLSCYVSGGFWSFFKPRKFCNYESWICRVVA
jgi:hypothetical protein